jgi:hypothetical protein
MRTRGTGVTEESNLATQIENKLSPSVGQGTVNAESALRLVLLLLTMWTLLSGLALTFFQGASGATIGGGLEGGQGEAAQRLLGVHLLVLAPVYGLIAWQPERYRLIGWLPYVTQGGVVLVTLFDIVTGKRDIQGAALPFFVALIFLVLLVYFLRASRIENPLAPPPEPETPAALPPVLEHEAPVAPAQPPREQDISD